MRLLQAYLLAGLLVVAPLAFADTGSVRVSAFPEISVADARSTVTVTAEVRDGSGRPAPNGTRVLFQTTLGTFREASVNTVDGYARATLVAGSLAGVAKVSASALSLSATSTAEIEFLPEGSKPDKAREYVEVFASRGVRYSMDYGVLTASGRERGVTVRLGSIQIEADDVQLDTTSDELRARKARVKAGGSTREFDELFLHVTKGRGYGTTTFDGPVVAAIVPQGWWLTGHVETRKRFGVVEVSPSGRVQPAAQPVSSSQFEFAEVADSETYITARKAVVFSRKQIQFHRAGVVVQGTRALSVPLYQLSLVPGSPQSLGEQILTFNDSRLGVNYPHYLTLKPGQTSLLRFHTGQRTGRAIGGSAGAFLDYELKWDRGSAMQGDLTVSALNTPNWSIDARQHLQLRDGASVNALVSVPARRSVFTSVGYSKPLGGFQLSLNANASRSLVGPTAQSQQLSLVLESNPARLKGLPLTLYYGLSASDTQSRSQQLRRADRSMGLRLRGSFDTFQLDRSTVLNLSFGAAQRFGGETAGLGMFGTAALNRQLGDRGNLALNYEYTDDPGFAPGTSGKQRLSLQSAYSTGKAALSVYASKSLDADWTSLYVDASYRLSDLYRLSGSYTVDQYLGDRYLDYNLTLAYRLGMRDVGLTWSRRTGRFGLEILGARF